MFSIFSPARAFGFADGRENGANSGIDVVESAFGGNQAFEMLRIHATQ